MNHHRLFCPALIALLCGALLLNAAADELSETKPPTQEIGAPQPMIEIKTSLGDMVLELDAEKAPLTVKNFLTYVDDGFYDGTIFHRVIDGFMVQGGGFTADMRQKPTRAPIANEAANGLRNAHGTIAMARTSDVNSATAQFFINVKDNAFLDHRDRSAQGFGYCVFGRVVSGLETLDAIRQAPTGRKGGMGDVPVEPVEILSVRRRPE